jgi:hypothetical protein
MRERLSAVSVPKGFLERLYVNFGILKNAYLTYPVDKDHLEWSQVGQGHITNREYCGRHMSFFVCNDFHTHEGLVFEGVDYTKKLAVSHGRMYCGKPSCPVCFLAWCADTARSIWGKLSVGVDRGFGEVDHFSVSFSEKQYDSVVEEARKLGVPFEGLLRKIAEDGCKRRGIMGGVLVPHARRIDKRRKALKFGMHYHGLGYVSGGVEICRHCEVFQNGRCDVDCGNCKGFEARTRREHVKDNLIVKVMGRRSSGLTMEESTIKTARYLLTHASQVVSFRKRFYIVSYFGVCANKKMKSRKVKAEPVCLPCESVGVRNVMKHMHYWGKTSISKDLGDPLTKRVFAMDEFDGSGLPNFVESGGGGSNE